jgi:hypothetical protein
MGESTTSGVGAPDANGETMTSDDKGSSRPGPGARRKRPMPQTIELDATEVAAAPAESSSAEQTAESPPASEPSGRLTVPEPEAAATPAVTAAADPHATISEPGQAEAAPAREEAEPSVGAPSDSVPPPSAPPPDRRPAGGFASHLRWPPSGAAIATTLAAALILAAALWLFGRDDGTEALSQRVATLETQWRQAADKPPPATADPRQVADLASRLAAAEQAVRRLDGSIATGLGRLQQAEERVAKVEAAPAPAPVAAAADPALGNRLTEADAALKMLAERLAAVEAALKPMTAQASSAAAIDQGLADRTAAAEAAVKSLRERLDELGRAVAEATQVARTAEQQASAAAKEAARGADRAVRLAVAATALRDVVMRGEPFAAELAAVKPLASDPARVAPLEPFAATGLPSAASLARELSGLVPALAAAATPARGDSMLDRLQTSAERFVRIRPVNEKPGDDPLPVITRIEARAAANDVDAARAELARLPEPARAPAQPWIQKVEKRAAALAAAQSLARDAVAALAKP